MSTTLHYALLGDGRLAKHFQYYLGTLNQPVSAWARNANSEFNTHQNPNAEERLRATIGPASHVLLLVSDDALTDLLRRYPFLHKKLLIHCAGVTSIPGVAGAHPLMTFGHELYTRAEYEAIPFTVEEGYRFEALFPALPNPHFPIASEHKALYHALCVMAGNFPQLLWQSVSDRLQEQLDLPQEVLAAYLRRSLENFLKDPNTALTGPLARGDHSTLGRNRNALDADALGGLFDAFVNFHHREQDSKPQEQNAPTQTRTRRVS